MKIYDNNPLKAEQERALYQAVRDLPATVSAKCVSCGHEYDISVLPAYSKCPKCGQQSKHRSFGGSGDVQDIMLIVLKWFSDAGMSIPEELKPLAESDWSILDTYYKDD